MKLLGKVKNYLKSEGYIFFLRDILFSTNGNPYIKVSKDKSIQDSMNLFFTQSFTEIKSGDKVLEVGLEKCVVWETISSAGTKVYRIGKMESLSEYKPYEQILENGSYITYSEKLNTLEWRDKRKRIIDREKGVCEICKDECIIDLETYLSKNMDVGTDFQSKWANVHHTYYLNNSLPWHYPNESLKLLCMGCHQDLHEKNDIKVYKDFTFSDEIHLSKCYKCAGTGYLPDYYYYHDGVCFGCDGTGFKNF